MRWNHFDENGNAVMVDVSEKVETRRTATAQGKIYVSQEIMSHVKNGDLKKGDVLGVAQVAGIMATKHTSDLIPMCHPLMLTKSSVEFEILESEGCIMASCTAKLIGKTGVEMEALTGVMTALLTIYDMCKAVDKNMVISDVHLVEKTGGKSGAYYFNRR